MEMLISEFAGAGLVGEMNSSETYGAVQARMGQYRAHANAEANGADLSDLRDRAQALVVPVHVTFALPGDGRAFVKLGGAAIYSRSEESRPTNIDSDGYNGLAEYLRRVGDHQLVGLGIVAETAAVTFQESQGTLDSSGVGLRVDYVNRLDAHSGLAVRAQALEGESTIRIPLGNGITIRSREQWRRYYTEARLLETYDHSALSWVPPGWFVRPALGLAYQATRGRGESPAKDENYGFIQGTVRLERLERRNWRLAPYVETGLIQQFVQDIARKGDDPSIFYAKLGGSTNLAGHGRFDFYYARREGLAGRYRQQTINLLVSVNF